MTEYGLGYIFYNSKYNIILSELTCFTSRSGPPCRTVAVKRNPNIATRAAVQTRTGRASVYRNCNI